jgi:serine/threonine protein kinase
MRLLHRSIMRPIPAPFDAVVGIDDDDFVGVLRSLLSVDPVKRPSAIEALDHPFIQKAFRSEPYSLPPHLRKRSQSFDS